MAKLQFQFSLAALQLNVAAVAVVLAVFLVPSQLGDALLVAIVICLSSLCLVGAACGGGDVRAFCLGASVPLGLMLLYFGTHLELLFETEWFMSAEGNRMHVVRKTIAMLIIGAIALGYLGVGFRRLIEAHDSQAGRESPGDE